MELCIQINVLLVFADTNSFKSCGYPFGKAKYLTAQDRNKGKKRNVKSKSMSTLKAPRTVKK